MLEGAGAVAKSSLLAAIDTTQCARGHRLTLADAPAGFIDEQAGRYVLGRAGDDSFLTDGAPAALWKASSTTGRHALRDWQVESLDAWCQHGRRGVIEAVTGTGKSWAGVELAREALADDVSIVVVVPTVDLVDQWVRTLSNNGILSPAAVGVNDLDSDELTSDRVAR